jgi:predicted metal-dependent hydrolase
MDIRVAVPMYISIKDAQKFVNYKLEWIEKRIIDLKNKTNAFKNLNKISDTQKQQILHRAEFLAKKYNFRYKKLTLRKMKSRWGSCSSKNNISLNIGLVNLPIDLQEYVMIHEFVHTMIKNHSSDFWNMLESFLPNSKQLNRRLNKEFGLYDI